MVLSCVSHAAILDRRRHPVPAAAHCGQKWIESDFRMNRIQTPQKSGVTKTKNKNYANFFVPSAPIH